MICHQIRSLTLTPALKQHCVFLTKCWFKCFQIPKNVTTQHGALFVYPSGNFFPWQSACSLMQDECMEGSTALTCCFLVCSLRRMADSSRVSSWAGLWWRGGSLAAVMSSRCFRSRSLLACAESDDEPPDEWLSGDPDGSSGDPLSGSLETMLRRSYVQIGSVNESKMTKIILNEQSNQSFLINICINSGHIMKKNMYLLIKFEFLLPGGWGLLGFFQDSYIGGLLWCLLYKKVIVSSSAV